MLLKLYKYIIYLHISLFPILFKPIYYFYLRKSTYKKTNLQTLASFYHLCVIISTSIRKVNFCSTSYKYLVIYHIYKSQRNVNLRHFMKH